MKWYYGLILVNAGLICVCFGLMARENLCQKNMEDAFFLGGVVLLVAGVVILFQLTISEIQRRIKAWLSWKK